MTTQIPMLLRSWARSNTAQTSSCLGDPTMQFSRESWIEICATRLGEVGHDGDDSELVLLATDLWADVGPFDPRIAAEIEHESWAACS